MPDLTQMSKTLEVDTDPNMVEGENAAPTKMTAEIGKSELEDLFAQVAEEEVEVQEDHVKEVEEEDVSEIDEVDEPADEPQEASEPEDVESSQEESEDDESEAEEEGTEEEPAWFLKRVNTLTSQRKLAEKRIVELESKIDALDAKEKDETPSSGVDSVNNIEDLSKLEDNAIQAEDQIDELLETEPEYNDNGDAYWSVDGKQWSRKDLIAARKNARTTFRAIPRRKELLNKREAYDKQVEDEPYFTDENHPFYQTAQAALKGDFFRENVNRFPETKAVFSLMIKGAMAEAAQKQSKEKKNNIKVPAKEPVLKSTPKSKAAGDTGTVKASSTPEKSQRRRIDKILSKRSVNKAGAVELFKKV